MRRRFTGFLRWVALGLAAIAVLLVVFLWVEHVRGDIGLRKYKAALEARGELVSLSSLFKPIRDRNGAPELIQAAYTLKQGKVVPGHLPARMAMTPSGEAVTAFTQARILDEKSEFEWADLADDLRTNSAALLKIRGLLASPVLDHRLDYAMGPSLPLPHLATTKSLTWWYGAECQLALHENRLEDALNALLSEIQLPRLLERDQILISELVRIAIVSIARSDTWEALQADEWTDDQLQRLQQGWEALRLLEGMLHGLEGERTFVTTTFDFCRRNNNQAASIIYSTWNPVALDDLPAWENALHDLPGGKEALGFVRNEFYCRVWRFAWVDQCEQRHLELLQQLVEVFRASTTNHSLLACEPAVDAIEAEARHGGFYDGLRYPRSMVDMAPFSRCLNRAMRVETERSLVLAAIALKRHALSGAPPPTSLDDLVPKYLASVPIDHMDGKPIRYRPRTDGAPILYSVGENGIDNGGDSSPMTNNPPTAHWWLRKDVVWPARASADQIEAAKAAKARRAR